MLAWPSAHLRVMGSGMDCGNRSGLSHGLLGHDVGEVGMEAQLPSSLPARPLHALARLILSTAWLAMCWLLTPPDDN